MVKCDGCGAENEENSGYCQNCGKKINNQVIGELKERSTVLIVAGYLIAVFGLLFLGLIIFVSFIIGVYLIRRGGPDRMHGIMLSSISVLLFPLRIVVLFLPLL